MKLGIGIACLGQEDNSETELVQWELGARSNKNRSSPYPPRSEQKYCEVMRISAKKEWEFV